MDCQVACQPDGSGQRAINFGRPSLIGKWRIVEADLWDRDYLDLVEPAHISFGKDGRGEFAAKQGLDRALAAELGEAFKPWRLDDLAARRRTLLTGELEVSRDIAELVLGHAQKGVEGTYDRGRYFRQKSAALQKLADFVERITSPPVHSHSRQARSWPVLLFGFGWLSAIISLGLL